MINECYNGFHVLIYRDHTKVTHESDNNSCIVKRITPLQGATRKITYLSSESISKQ